MTPIEKAARALYDAPDSQSGDTIGTVIWNSEHLFYETVEGEEIVDTARRASMPVCRDAVRAVLQAIREPSEGMVEEGDAAHAANTGYQYSAVHETWQAMIDAALSE